MTGLAAELQTSLFDACRAAVAAGDAAAPRAALGQVIGGLRRIAPVLGTRAGSDDGEIAAPVERGRALSALAQAMASGSTDSVDELVETWSEACQWACVLPDGSASRNPKPGFVPDDDSSAARLIHALASGDPTPVRGVIALTATALAGAPPAERHPVDVPVLFDRSVGGDSGRLRLTLVREGPAGLFPHPTAMALFAGDDAFRASLTRAWADSPVDLRDRCVLWTIEVSDGPCDHARDGSLGGAFAVGLIELARKARRLAFLRRAFALAPRIAISAQLGPAGALQAVGRLDHKLEAAAARHWSVVLPEASRQDAEAVGEGVAIAAVRRRYAGDVRTAVRLTRRRPSPSLLVAALAVLTSVIAGAVYVNSEAEASRDRHDATLLRRAEDLRRIATGTGRDTVHDQATQALLLLAGAELAADAGEPDTAAAILNESIVVEGGAVSTLRTDIGQLWQLDLVGDKLLATSTSGRLAHLNASTGDEISLHTELPGQELSNQRLPRALATHPRADVIAAVMRVWGSGEARQRLVYLSHSSQPLRPEATPMTDLGELWLEGAPLTALSYDEDGAYLLGASHENLVLFWSGGGPPEERGRCALTPSRGGSDTPADPVELVVDRETDVARVVFEDGRVLGIGNVWERMERSAGSGATCGDVEILPPATRKGLASVGRGPSLGADGGNHLAAGELLVATATPEGRVVELRRAGMQPTTPPAPPQVVEVGSEGPPIDAIDLRSDGVMLAVAREGESADPFVETYDLTTPSSEPTQTFADYRAPLAYVGPQRLLATDKGNNIIGVLTDEDYILPGGGAAPSTTDDVATGTSAFALADIDARNVHVHHFDPDKPARSLSFPRPWAIHRAGMFGRAFDIDDDGSLLAVALSDDDEIGATSVGIWDVEAGAETALLDPELPDYGPGLLDLPIGVRFLPGHDTVIVGYLHGDIVRFDRRDGGWRPTRLREGHRTAAMWGLDVDAAGRRVSALTFEQNAAGGGWYQSVEVLSPDDGELVRSWDLTDLGLGLGPPDNRSALASAIPLSTGDVIVAVTSGAVYKLGEDGEITAGEPVDIGAVTSGAELRADGTVMLSGLERSVSLSTEGVVRTAESGVDNRSLSAVGVTSDHRYMIGTSFVFEEASVVPLGAGDRRSLLCSSAGRELTESEWSTYVGRIADQRPLCASELRSEQGFRHAVWDIGTVNQPALLQNPRISEVDHYRRWCDPDVRSAEVVASSAGRLTWAAGTTGPLDDDLLAVVCVEGRVRWLLTRSGLTDGGSDPQHLRFTVGTGDYAETLAISLPRASQDDDPPVAGIDVVNADGLVASMVRDRAFVAAAPDGFYIDYQAGEVSIQAELGEVPTSSRLGFRRRVPGFGAAGTDSTIDDPTPVLGGDAPALRANPYSDLGAEQLIAAAGSSDKVGIVANDAGPFGTVRFRPSPDELGTYELVAWRNDNYLVCNADPALLGDQAEAMYDAAQCAVTRDGLILTTIGLGPLEIGMTSDQAIATGVVRTDPSSDLSFACVTIPTRFPLPEEVDAVFENGRLAGVTVWSGSIPTTEGIRLGNTATEVRQSLGRPSSDDGVKLTYQDDDERQMTFTLTEDRVSSISAGVGERTCAP